MLCTLTAALLAFLPQSDGLGHVHGSKYIPLHDMHVGKPMLGGGRYHIEGDFYLGVRTEDSFPANQGPRLYVKKEASLGFVPTGDWQFIEGHFENPKIVADTPRVGDVKEGSQVHFTATLPEGWKDTDPIWAAVTLDGVNHTGKAETSVVANEVPSLSASAGLKTYLTKRISVEGKNTSQRKNLSRILDLVKSQRKKNAQFIFKFQETNAITPITLHRAWGGEAAMPKHKHTVYTNGPAALSPFFRLFYSSESTGADKFLRTWKDLLRDDPTSGHDNTSTDVHEVHHDKDISYIMVIDESDSFSDLGDVYEWSAVIRKF